MKTNTKVSRLIKDGQDQINPVIAITVLQARAILTLAESVPTPTNNHEIFKSLINSCTEIAVASFCHYCTEPFETRSFRGYKVCKNHIDDKETM